MDGRRVGAGERAEVGERRDHLRRELQAREAIALDAGDQVLAAPQVVDEALIDVPVRLRAHVGQRRGRQQRQQRAGDQQNPGAK